MSEPQILRPFDAAEACSPVEASRIAGVSDETIRQWACKHDLGRRIGGRWRISRAALRMHLDGNKAALRALLAGDRDAPIVRPYLEAVESSKKDATKTKETKNATNASTM